MKIVVDDEKLAELISKALYERTMEAQKRHEFEKQQERANEAERALVDYTTKAPKAEGTEA